MKSLRFNAEKYLFLFWKVKSGEEDLLEDLLGFKEFVARHPKNQKLNMLMACVYSSFGFFHEALIIVSQLSPKSTDCLSTHLLE